MPVLMHCLGQHPHCSIQHLVVRKRAPKSRAARVLLRVLLRWTQLRSPEAPVLAPALAPAQGLVHWSSQECSRCNRQHSTGDGWHGHGLRQQVHRRRSRQPRPKGPARIQRVLLRLERPQMPRLSLHASSAPLNATSSRGLHLTSFQSQAVTCHLSPSRGQIDSDPRCDPWPRPWAPPRQWLGQQAGPGHRAAPAAQRERGLSHWGRHGSPNYRSYFM